ncbi:MAG: hypothetical protein DWG80_00390 [Chloroflexi bacterium]|nr:hypothetical protein [Chloroflexota bacterium]
MRVEHGFEVLLAEFSLDQIEDEHGSVFGIFADGRLALTNTAWTRFVEENGAPHLPADWPLGRNIYEVIPAELQSFYREGWEWAGESGHPWSHSYECSSPDSYRRYRMTSYPIGGTAGILVVNSLVAQASWPDGTASPLSRAEYRRADGVITQCSHCRRTEHVASGRWDWVPEWVQRWPDDAHGALCDICSAYHYYEEARAAPTGH